MSKVMLDKDSFKALASETRLDILKALDGKKLNLKDLCSVTKLQKATLHVHLTKLLDAGFIKKKERDGHKWVYYKLTWKGESLLHPENSRIVVLFSSTFFALFCGIIQLINFARGTIVGFATTASGATTTQIFSRGNTGIGSYLSHNINFIQVAEVPVENQSLNELTQQLSINSDITGLIGNSIPESELRWNVIENTKGMAFEGVDVSTSANNVVATVQDPALLYIGIVCFIIFLIILGVSLWRLWENRTPKL